MRLPERRRCGGGSVYDRIMGERTEWTPRMSGKKGERRALLGRQGGGGRGTGDETKVYDADDDEDGGFRLGYKITT